MPSPLVEPTRDYIAAALIGARPLILKMYGADSSVFSTRVALAVFDHFGFDAEPVPVYVIIANPKLVPALNDGSVNIYDKGTWPEGAHSVALGVGGHLVCVSGDVMLDLALDRANQEHAGIALSARAFRVTPEWMAGAPMQFEDAGCSLAYTRDMGAGRWWGRHKQWGERVIRKGLAGDVIRAIKRS